MYSFIHLVLIYFSQVAATFVQTKCIRRRERTLMLSRFAVRTVVEGPGDELLRVGAVACQLGNTSYRTITEVKQR